MKRRELLLRIGGLAGLGVLGVMLGGRGESCERTNPCQDCPLRDGCDLPVARHQEGKAVSDEE
ncbi:hypothetical protein [Haloferula sp.]|uniref:hypothetical protein n=1 Tax=Haloferula sp. TaxID=2497595 RepID=UPI003C770871